MKWIILWIKINKRGVFTNNGTEVGLVGVPVCDIFNMLLLDGLEIKVKVDLNSDVFVLMGGETPNNCKLQIMSSTLGVRTVREADSTKLEHLQIMQGQKDRAALPAVYTLTRAPTHAKIISRGGIKSYADRSFQWSYSSMPYSVSVCNELICL